MAKSHHALALVLRERGRLEDAEAELRQASVLHGKLGNADHPDVAAVHHDLAEVLLARGRASEALEHATRAWERRRRGDLPQAARARSAFVLAQVLWATGRDAQTRGKARALAEEAMEGAEAEEDAAEVRAWLAAHGGRG